MTFPIALASYSFHGLHKAGDLNLLAYLELLYARYHVANADIWTGLLPPAALEADYLKKIRRFMDDRQLTLANLCVDGPVLWDDDPDKRAANRLTMLRYIEAAGILGARTIRIDFGGNDGPMSDESLASIEDEISAKITVLKTQPTDDIPATVKQIEMLLFERNNKSKLLK